MRTLERSIISIVGALLVVPTGAAAQSPAPSLLTPDNSAILLVDHQPQMAFAVASHDAGDIVNNTVGLAKTAKAFSVPLVLSTVAAETFSGPIFEEVQGVHPEMQPIDRTTMNAWEDPNFVRAVQATGRTKLVIAGLWTEVCVTLPALSALAEGYEVYVVTDASGGVTREAHDMAVQRMIQAGAIPMTWLQVLLEYQRDWARTETYAATTAIVKEHGRAYGLGVYYAKAMLHVSGEAPTNERP
jgi:nicotinamidase-related amidase